jgi:hypothetical protein
MTCPLLLLLLPAADPSHAPEAEQAFVMSKLTPAEAAFPAGKRAKFRIVLDSTDDTWDGFVGYDVRCPEPFYATVRLYPRQEVADEMTVEATLRVIHHPATVGAMGTLFPAFLEYRLTKAVRVP